MSVPLTDRMLACLRQWPEGEHLTVTIRALRRRDLIAPRGRTWRGDQALAEIREQQQ